MTIMFSAVIILFVFLFIQNTHLLGLLVALEMLVLYSFVYLAWVSEVSFFFLLVFLMVMATESAVALVLFIIFNQLKSKDYIKVMSLLTF